MRELYAVELKAEGAADGADRVEGMVRQWVSNPFGDLSPDELVDDETISTTTGSIRSRRSEAGWLLDWRARNDADDSLVWQTQVAVGPAEADLLITVRIGIGQHHDRPTALGRLDYEFKSPAIVRTLLRELTVMDAGRRVEPSPQMVGASGVENLVAFVCSNARRLPVVVLTGTAETGLPIPDARELAKQLAGLAHVVVLTSSLAGRNLTELVGRERSVWLGAARIYWPGFNVDSNPYDHKLWMAQRLAQSPLPLDLELRRWIGGLAAARTPEHPAASVELPRPSGPIDELPDWAQEYVEAIEASNRELTTDLKVATADLAARDEAINDLRAQVEQLKESFVVVSAASIPATSPGDATLTSITSVREAIDRAIDEAGDRIIFLDRAKQSGYDFEGYNDPERLYKALADVTEASELFGKGGSLGMSLGAWFQQRGYEYSATNDVAYDHRYKPKYTINYNDRKEVMEPHLKVDQGTSPDQCLRIYWYVDEDERIFVVGHIGRHLPPT